jgi:hypothetical protein
VDLCRAFFAARSWVAMRTASGDSVRNASYQHMGAGAVPQAKNLAVLQVRAAVRLQTPAPRRAGGAVVPLLVLPRGTQMLQQLVRARSGHY